jgi:hypothetical protein
MTLPKARPLYANWIALTISNGVSDGRLQS